eukprot:3233321-Pleurochrysis_carterae.AAC.1
MALRTYGSAGIRLDTFDTTSSRGDDGHLPARHNRIVRKGDAWEAVNIEPSHAAHKTPRVVCKFCDKVFMATHPRITEHVLGNGNSAACKG